MGKKRIVTRVKVIRERSRRFMASRRKANDRLYLRLARRLYRTKRLRPLARLFYKVTIRHRIRFTASSLVALMLATAIMPVYMAYKNDQRYALSEQSIALLGKSNENLTKKLSFNKQKHAYQFNTDNKKSTPVGANPIESMQSLVGGEGEKDQQPYSVDIPADLSRGITYHDNQTQLSFTMVPQFKTMMGQMREGHLVYPLADIDGQVSYTVTASGLKENVVLYSKPSDTLRMQYKLELPASLEARLIPGTGELGIYSADPSLFGDITYGSSSDQEKIEQARNQSEKSFLTFKIPAPYANGLTENNQTMLSPVSSSFALSKSVLTVSTRGLDTAQYPLAIDPSVTVSGASGFDSGNKDDNNIDTATGSARRGALTGGLQNNYADTTAFGTPRSDMSTVVYNGYMYVIGGKTAASTYTNSVRYGKINADGTVTGWANATSYPAARAKMGAVVYNGSLILSGGQDNSTAYSEVYTIKINANGTLGATWTPTTPLPTARHSHGSVAYKGYIYSIGGQNSAGAYLTENRYAAINAEGTVGSWVTTGTSPLPAALAGHSTVVYNDNIYVLLGRTSDTTRSSEVLYAPLRPAGSIGAWVSTNTLDDGSARWGASATVYNGYIYLVGGFDGSTNRNDVRYSLIHNDGSLGRWFEGVSYYDSANARIYGSTVAYNGYIYTLGGMRGTTYLQDIRYASIKPPGTVTYGIDVQNPTVARKKHSIVAYNGYMYLLGGENGSGTKFKDVYRTKINASGAFDPWTYVNDFTTGAGRVSFAAAAYNGYMYLVGGDDGDNKADVLSAKINVDGSLGTWSTAPSASLDIPRREMASYVYNGKLYLFGGYNTNNVGNVGFFPLNNDGSIGPYSSTTSLNRTSTMNDAVIYNGFAYVTGGYSGTAGFGGTEINNTQRAAVSDTGAVGTWTANVGSLPSNKQHHRMIVDKGYLYVLGGSTNGNLIYASKINADGSIGAWSVFADMRSDRRMFGAVVYGDRMYTIGGQSGGTASNVVTDSNYNRINYGGFGGNGTVLNNTNKPVARMGHTSAVNNGFAYVVGGQDDSGYRNDIQYSTVNRVGSLTSFTTNATTFNTPRSKHASVVSNNFVYILGGTNGTALNDVQYAPINTDGSVGVWSTSSNTFTGARYDAAVGVSGGRIYLVGGTDGTTSYSDIQYATLNADGSIGGWTTNPTPLPTTKSDFGMAIYNGVMYVSGGIGPGGEVLGLVETSVVNPDGTIGAWRRYGSSLSFPTYGHTLTAYNGYLYAVGGKQPTATSTIIQSTQLSTTGKIDNPWETLGGTLSSSRHAHSAFAYNGNLYVIGGQTDEGSGATIQETVEYTPLYTIPRKALYSKTLDMAVPSNIVSVAYTGVLADERNNIKYRLAAQNGVYGAIRINGSACKETEASQYVQVYIQMDDTYTSAVYGDDNIAATAHVDSITAIFKPYIDPSKRLRHGQIFFKETKQVFDAPSDTCV